jgi:hypothetical protein
MRARPVVSVLVSALVVLLAAGASVAQTQPGDLTVISIIDIKPDQFAEFGEVQAEAMAAQRKGGQPWRETWNVATFGHPYRVGVVRPMAGYAELDGPSFTLKGVGAEQAAAINERARKMIDGQQIYAVRTRADLGYGDRPAVMQVAVLTTMTVAPGRHAEFEAIVREVVIPAFKKAGEAYLGVSQVVLGGDPNQYLAMSLYDSFAEIDTKGDPVLRALGPAEFSKYRQRLAGIVTHEDRSLLRFNPALSYRGAPAQ